MSNNTIKRIIIYSCSIIIGICLNVVYSEHQVSIAPKCVTKYIGQRKDLPVTFKFTTAVSPSWVKPTQNAIKTINEAVGREIVLFDTNDRIDNIYIHNAVIDVTREYVSNIEIAVTNSQIMNKVFITYSSITFNLYSFSFYTNSQDKKTGYYNVETVMLHEMLHALGLDHTEKGILQPMLNYDDDFITIDDKTKETLRCLYGSK